MQNYLQLNDPDETRLSDQHFQNRATTLINAKLSDIAAQSKNAQRSKYYPIAPALIDQKDHTVNEGDILFSTPDEKASKIPLVRSTINGMAFPETAISPYLKRGTRNHTAADFSEAAVKYFQNEKLLVRGISQNYVQYDPRGGVIQPVRMVIIDSGLTWTVNTGTENIQFGDAVYAEVPSFKMDAPKGMKLNRKGILSQNRRVLMTTPMSETKIRNEFYKSIWRTDAKDDALNGDAQDAIDFRVSAIRNFFVNQLLYYVKSVMFLQDTPASQEIKKFFETKTDFDNLVAGVANNAEQFESTYTEIFRRTLVRLDAVGVTALNPRDDDETPVFLPDSLAASQDMIAKYNAVSRFLTAAHLKDPLSWGRVEQAEAERMGFRGELPALLTFTNVAYIQNQIDTIVDYMISENWVKNTGLEDIPLNTTDIERPGNLPVAQNTVYAHEGFKLKPGNGIESVPASFPLAYSRPNVNWTAAKYFDDTMEAFLKSEEEIFLSKVYENHSGTKLNLRNRFVGMARGSAAPGDRFQIHRG